MSHSGTIDHCFTLYRELINLHTVLEQDTEVTQVTIDHCFTLYRELIHLLTVLEQDTEVTQVL